MPIGANIKIQTNTLTYARTERATAMTVCRSVTCSLNHVSKILLTERLTRERLLFEKSNTAGLGP